MFLISHRGNTNSIQQKQENNPFFLDKLLKIGYNVEIDVWLINNELFLGHDNPEYLIDLKYLKNELFWCHAKNLEALQFMIKNRIHCFWHQEDDFTLTSKGYIWTYPGKPVCERSIIVCRSKEETLEYSKFNIAGICSDYTESLK
jgi:hypothetical protein